MKNNQSKSANSTLRLLSAMLVSEGDLTEQKRIRWDLSFFPIFTAQNVGRTYIGIIYLINIECCYCTICFGIRSDVLTWGFHLNDDGMCLSKNQTFSNKCSVITTIYYSWPQHLVHLRKYLLKYYSLQNTMKSIAAKTDKIHFLPFALWCSDWTRGLTWYYERNTSFSGGVQRRKSHSPPGGLQKIKTRFYKCKKTNCFHFCTFSLFCEITISSIHFKMKIKANFSWSLFVSNSSFTRVQEYQQIKLQNSTCDAFLL